MQPTLQKKPKLYRYVYKASWRATALKFWVEARDEEHAYKKAARLVTRMEGGMCCLDLELLRSTEPLHEA